MFLFFKPPNECLLLKQLDNLNYNLFVLFLILNTFPNEPPPKNSNLVYLNPNRSVPFESRTVCIFLFKVHYYKKLLRKIKFLKKSSVFLIFIKTMGNRKKLFFEKL